MTSKFDSRSSSRSSSSSFFKPFNLVYGFFCRIMLELDYVEIFGRLDTFCSPCIINYKAIVQGIFTLKLWGLTYHCIHTMIEVDTLNESFSLESRSVILPRAPTFGIPHCRVVHWSEIGAIWIFRIIFIWNVSRNEIWQCWM